MAKKGKNFSTNNASGKRKESDFYGTPYELTRRFLDKNTRLSRLATVLEPACGDGAIVRVLKEKGFSKVVAYDKETDFLKETKQYTYIITNPPYSLAYEFIQKAKEVAIAEFSMLLPLSYLHGKKRYDNIWMDTAYPLREINVFTRYPMLGETLREDGKMNTGMMVYCWYTWDKGYEGKPTIDWIDINDCILSKKNKATIVT